MFWIIFIGTMAISFLAVMRVKATYLRYSRVPASSGYNGAEVAHQILRAAGIDDVEICEKRGTLADHYDPIHKRLVLSSENYHGTSVAALGVAAHECGHAIQHKIAYAPLKWRMAAIGATTFANQIVLWIPILGMFTGLIAPYTGLLIMAIAWGIIMLFNLVTLPVEFDASRRAKVILGKMSFIQEGKEAQGVNNVLNAAGWTYVAAFITSLVYFLWYLLPLLGGGRRN
ncbi:MAG: zinc metallopeptidase [Verrucomicrobiae bacterium]|nr:zinc metallopeptidase [Verrucomicrobiae bacterium]